MGLAIGPGARLVLAFPPRPSVRAAALCGPLAASPLPLLGLLS